MQHSPTHSRRSVLKSATLAAASLAATSSVASAADELLQPAEPRTRDSQNAWRGLKAGVASYSLRKLPLDATIRGTSRVGLAYVSIKDFHLPLKSTAEERKAVAKQFRDAGITPISCGVITLPNDEAAVLNAFEYTRDIGAPVMVCNPDPAVMPILDRMVKQFDLRLAIHNHGPEDNRYPSPYEALKAAAPFDERIGLCIDVGHTARAKADPAKAIRDCRARLYDVHFKDVAHLDRRGSEVECGRGVLDVRSMLQALLDINYAYHLGFEHEKHAEDPLPGLAESVGYTRGVLSTLG